MKPGILYGFHAVTVRLKTAPESVIEVHVDAARRDARMRGFVERAQAAGARIIDSDDARRIDCGKLYNAPISPDAKLNLTVGEKRRLGAEGKASQRLSKLALRQIRKQDSNVRRMDNKVRISFNLACIRMVIVNPVTVQRNRRETEQVNGSGGE